MNIKKGDTVQIIKGKDRGKTGTVEKTLPSNDKVVVAGVNVHKHHLRRTQSRPTGGIVEIPAPIARANVKLVCPNCSQATKVKGGVTESGVRFRACSKCAGNVDSK